MPLTDISVRAARSNPKPYKLHDKDGLFVLVHPNGSKYWRLKYYFADKEKLLALGVYPQISVAEARKRCGEARKLLEAGNDPVQVKHAAKRTILLNSATTFEAIAREWHERKSHTWVPKHAAAVLKRLERDTFPKLGNRPISEIDAPELLSNLREIEKRGALGMTQAVKQYCNQIFSYAIATGRAKYNPAANLKGALKTPVTKHHAHLKETELPEFLKKLEVYDGELQTKLALKFLLLTFVRTVEIRGAEWAEIKFDTKEWRIPAARMKMKDPHIVPLSTQAISVLRELQKHSGNRQHVFPNSRRPSNFMSENTMLFALYRMGYHSRTTGHGFRATASTILNENGFPPDVIERQLAHAERNKVRAAYNHAQYLPERRKMMQWWGDYLEGLSKKDGNDKRRRESSEKHHSVKTGFDNVL